VQDLLGSIVRPQLLRRLPGPNLVGCWAVVLGVVTACRQNPCCSWRHRSGMPLLGTCPQLNIEFLGRSAEVALWLQRKGPGKRCVVAGFSPRRPLVLLTLPWSTAPRSVAVSFAARRGPDDVLAFYILLTAESPARWRPGFSSINAGSVNAALRQAVGYSPPVCGRRPGSTRVACGYSVILLIGVGALCDPLPVSLVHSPWNCSRPGARLLTTARVRNSECALRVSAHRR